MPTDARVDHAQRWMARATNDLAAIEQLESGYLDGSQTAPQDAALAVYLLQQFTEKTVKALLVIDGVDPSSRGARFRTHASLHLYFRLLTRSLERPGMRDALSGLDAAGLIGETSLQDQIDELEALEAVSERHDAVMPKDIDEGTLNSPRFWNDLRAMSADSITGMLASVDAIEKASSQIGEILLQTQNAITVPDDLADSNDLMRDLIDVVSDALPEANVQESHRRPLAAAARAILGTEGVEDLRNEIRLGIVPLGLESEDLADPYRDLVTSMSIYVLAAVTFPHESHCRYPASPDAPEDPIKAASNGSLGTEHYRHPLGIVVQLNALIQQARYVSSAIDRNYFAEWQPSEA